MKPWILIPLALPLLAAAPHRQLSLAVPPDALDLFAAPQSPGLGGPVQGPVYEPAPLPNRDVNGPARARASTDPSLAPSLFTTKNQYRGDGFAPNSTAQSEQEKRVKPGAGFTLHMPFKDQ